MRRLSKVAMEWQLTWGENEAYLRDLQADGTRIEALEHKPELSIHQSQAFEAFWLISPGRPIGFGAAGGITTSDILAMADMAGFEPSWFLRVVRAMDRVYLEAANQPAKHGNRPPRSRP